MQILRISLWIWITHLFISIDFIHCSTISGGEKEVVDLLCQNQVCLIVMRHGEALHNLSHLMVSTRSPGIYLTEKGVKQVENTANRLSKEQVGMIYVSPVYRTLQTAQIVGKALHLPYQKIAIEKDLREQFFGEFEGLTYREYVAYFSSPEDVFVGAVPGGESGQELFNRTRRMLLKIAQKHSHETVLLVTHAFNCCQISKCLTGSYWDSPEQAEYKVYDFRK
jgi:broad specificity phosphatase PhoE